MVKGISLYKVNPKGQNNMTFPSHGAEDKLRSCLPALNEPADPPNRNPFATHR